jgi:hypothetical protein
MALSTPHISTNATIALPATVPAAAAQSTEVIMQDATVSDRDTAASNQNTLIGSDPAWKQFTKTIPFLGVPPEIHLRVLAFLNPIDAVCLSLIKYVCSLSRAFRG